MRAWKQETNSTKLAPLPFVSCIGEDTVLVPESAERELMAASGFWKLLSQGPPRVRPLSQSYPSHLAQWPLLEWFQGCQGP